MAAASQEGFVGNQERGSVEENLSVIRHLADQLEDVATSREGLAAGGSVDDNKLIMAQCVQNDCGTEYLEINPLKRAKDCPKSQV